MKQCAILSMDNLDDFGVYDQLFEPPLLALGWECHWVSWRKQDVDWNRFDVVLIRTPWDYQDDAEGFIKVLEAIEQSSARLENSLKVVRWNIHKGYLKELAARGVAIVDSLWAKSFDAELFDTAFDNWQTSELVIKPCISANADDTFRLSKAKLNEQKARLAQYFDQRDHVIQPFIEDILVEGEYSLFYFFNQYSHAILKTPKAGDFRVQEEHGGRLALIEPEQSLRAIADHAMSVVSEILGGSLAYARLDFVRTEKGFALMEAELIEPSLYFNMDPESPTRFARLFDDHMRNSICK